MLGVTIYCMTFKIVYVMDTSTQAYVEECIVWYEKETLVVSKLRIKQ